MGQRMWSAGDCTGIVTALTALIMAVVTLVKVLQTLEAVEEHGEVLKKIESATNGTLSSQTAEVARLNTVKATQQELSARTSSPRVG